MTERGEWEAWLEYFLNGVARQSEDAVGRAERINAMLGRWRAAIAGTPSKGPRLVELLAENPFWTVKGVAARLGVAYTTAQRAVEALVSRSILVQTTDARRDRVYCAQAILDLLEEPARLRPALEA